MRWAWWRKNWGAAPKHTRVLVVHRHVRWLDETRDACWRLEGLRRQEELPLAGARHLTLTNIEQENLGSFPPSLIEACMRHCR
jgi:hypothetical protein